ncbi:MAG TPA: alpha-E domain-containing protein [Verrucomicrobiae bacterium]|nr:alpha-E domain-containing protein [Verrucomicrobiae bacterium]
MLSRVAESIYWMSRYTERAENVARFIEVNLQLMLDAPAGSDQQWEPLVATTGDHQHFAKRYGAPSQQNVIQFLTFAPENPNSILSCLRAARENARTVREIIASEMWLQLNKFYLMVTDAAGAGGRLAAPHEFFAEVKLASHLFCGISEATMTHGEPWHFARLGQMLERADKTSRILDVKYFILLRSVEDIGTPFDDMQWAAVLRSASAFEMFRKRQGRLTPRGVVEFLLLDREFPRAIHYCLLSARDSLHAISGTPVGTFRQPAEKLLGQLCSDLSYASVDEIIAAGLHEYLDHLQTRMNQVGTGIHDTFFAFRTPSPTRKPPPPQPASQVQAQ